MSLPIPDQASQQHSDRVRDFICQEIRANGPISFYDYMRFALYAPGLGYYSAGAHKLGKGGDFVTAPELSPLFSWCLARQCAEVMQQLEQPAILELGAGSGVMALEILRELKRLEMLPQKYFILEVSADLAERQKKLFEQAAPEFLAIVQWLDALPDEPIKGVILANEVVDAMPVHRFKIENGVKEFFVALEEERFIWQVSEPSSTELSEAIQSLELALPNGYCSEVNLQLGAWLKALAQCLTQGVMLFIDYGYTQAEFYHPERHMGTLVCHYQHYAHDDLLIFPGIQDITANVDFTALASAGVDSNMSVAGYVHQAGFLMNLGLTDFVAGEYGNVEHYEMVQQVKKLTLPTEMGERFKVLGFVKEYTEPLLGFKQFDQVARL